MSNTIRQQIAVRLSTLEECIGGMHIWVCAYLEMGGVEVRGGV